MEFHALLPPRPLALYPQLFHDSEILRWALRFYFPLFSQILNGEWGSAWNSIDQKCSIQGTRSCPRYCSRKKMPIPLGLRPRSIRRRLCRWGVQEVLCRKNEALTPFLGVGSVSAGVREGIQECPHQTLRIITKDVILNNHKLYES